MNSVTSLLLFLQSCLPSDLGSLDQLDGRWDVVANGVTGTLVLHVAEDGQVTGTIFSEKVEGVFDPKNDKFSFKRVQTLPSGESSTVQTYRGQFSVDAGGHPTICHLEGTFKAFAKNGWGAVGVEYKWTAVKALPVFSRSLRSLQGSWKVEHSRGKLGQFGFAKEFSFEKVGETLSIHGNELRNESRLIGTLATEIESNGAILQPAYSKSLMITLADGRAALCSYQLNDTELIIEYPFGADELSGIQCHLKRLPQDVNSVSTKPGIP